MGRRARNAEAALAVMRDRLGPGPARVYAPGVAAEPRLFAEAMRADPGLAADLVFTGVWIPGVNRTDWAGLAPSAGAETIFLSPELRASFEAGRTRLLPLTYMQAWRRLEAVPLDAAILSVSPPDRTGACSLSLADDFTRAAWRRARVRVAQLNPALPPMPGAASVPLDAFDAVVEAETEPPGYDPGALPPAFARIAQHAAAYVEDGDAVQFGLGKVQLALLPALAGRRGLHVRSGMVSDPLLPLMDGETIASVATGAVLGGRALARRLGADTRMRMSPVAETHAAAGLAAGPPLKAVNSVIAVDLFGQADAEFVDGRQVSGGGGLADFARGAQASGGLSIVALASTARGGTVSRITPRLGAGAVSLSRNEIDVVVTEHGAAELRGRDVDGRARALIAIADPAFRERLDRDWAELRRGM